MSVIVIIDLEGDEAAKLLKSAIIMRDADLKRIKRLVKKLGFLDEFKKLGIDVYPIKAKKT
jgi:hypothetical protein